jgi:hypothetical protein
MTRFEEDLLMALALWVGCLALVYVVASALLG